MVGVVVVVAAGYKSDLGHGIAGRFNSAAGVVIYKYHSSPLVSPTVYAEPCSKKLGLASTFVVRAKKKEWEQ